MNKLPKEIEERFNEKFPYHAVEYGENYEIRRTIFPEIKSFLATILEEERARLAKEVEEIELAPDQKITEFLDNSAAEVAEGVGYGQIWMLNKVLSLLSPSKDGELKE